MEIRAINIQTVGGVMREKATKNERTHSTYQLIKKFKPYFRKYRHILAFDLFCASLTMICDITLPMFLRFIVNTGLEDIALLSVDMIVKLGLVFAAFKVIDMAAHYYMANIGHVMGAMIETDMRRDLFEHLNTLSHSYYSNTKVGQLMSRITTDLFDVTEFAHHCPEEFFIGALKFVIALVILLTINIPLTLILFTMIPLMIYFSSRLNQRMRRAFKKQRNHIGDLNANVEDSLLGIKVVKSFANEELELDKFEGSNHHFLDIKKETYRYMAAFQATTRFFDGLMYLIVLVCGGIFLMNGSITAGDLLAYSMFVATMLGTVRRIVEFMEQFQRGMTGIERFAEVMETEPDVLDREDAVPMSHVEGDIRFHDVDFTYTDNDKMVLKQVDFEASKGQTVALVGPSGAGKTTICNLIPRFYDVTGGSITIDGKDIREFTLKSLRQNIGVVEQDVYLFSGSVFDNIQYGKPGASFEEVVHAARLAGAYEFIMQLHSGFDTYVGERGVKLSGGQKQRISIARVFLKNPPILIMDEATSSLDNQSERIVQKSLEALSVGRTTIVIAHRLSTIKNASKILVLSNEGIKETGTHDELIAKNGLYADLYASGAQF